MALPANISFTTVTGRFIRAVADSLDAGKEPDAAPVTNATITFTPNLASPIVTNVAADVSIIIDPIVCTTDSAGYLLGPDGTPGVMLVSSDDPDLDPHGWTWQVTVRASTITPQTKSFVAPSGQSLSLTRIVPVPASPGAQISQWQVVVGQVTAVRNEVIAIRDDILENGGGGGLPADTTLDDINEGVTAKRFTTAEKSKLSGIASGATVNSADGALRDRSTHTGSQAIGTVTGLQSALDGKASTVHAHAKADVGLGNVDNTADSAKTFTASQIGSGTFADARIPSLAISKTTGLQAALDAKAAVATAQTVVRWTGTAWEARPSTAPFGVLFLSTNDAAAAAPTDGNLKSGDVWRRHPDAQ